MKNVIFVFLFSYFFCGCATYKPQFPKPGERVNPYDQRPVPDDGFAGFARNVINKYNK